MLERPVRRHLVRLLDSLPVIAHFAGRLELQAIIDQTCPSRSNAQLAPGQVALAIIANRLTQPKDMYQLLTWTQQWGVREVFGFDPTPLNDDRLGRCLDALAPQINPIQDAVTVAAIRELDLDLSQLHWERAFEHLFLVIEENTHGRGYAMSEFSPEQAELWRLLGIQEPVWT